ncbi:integumentary mucin C.1-like [Cyprinus carpio]|uniref:Integumentary mucin C.1-like n=1 Tax=Cyprinus carpio TaxID=7962 RepID=A0A9Q9ZPJ7_CYPCA|nr:integumentary mucin C.1-like [Cyprinus carpio]
MQQISAGMWILSSRVEDPCHRPVDPWAAETSIAPSTRTTAPELTCKIATAASIVRLTKNPAPTCISATATSTARSSTTTPAPQSTSRSAVTEPTSTTQSRPPAPTLSSTVLTSTTLSSTASTSISAAVTSTSQKTAQLTYTTQPASVPQNMTALASATFKLRCFAELSNDEIITYIEKFVKHFQSSISGTIKITVRKSRKLLA